MLSQRASLNDLVAYRFCASSRWKPFFFNQKQSLRQNRHRFWITKSNLILLSVTCALIGIMPGVNFYRHLGVVLISISAAGLFPASVVLFVSGYGRESYRETNYLNTTCSVTSILVYFGSCRGSRCWRYAVTISWMNSQIGLPVNGTSDKGLYTTDSIALYAAIDAWGQNGESFLCYYDPKITDTTGVVLTHFVQKEKPDASSLLIISIMFLLASIISMIAAVTFLVLGNPTCCGLRRRANDDARAPTSAPSSPSQSRPLGQPKEVEIDLNALTLDASVSMNSDDTCNICFAHRVCTAMQPCGHSYACKTCGNYFLGKPCGICRAIVTKVEINHFGSAESPVGSSTEESAESNG